MKNIISVIFIFFLSCVITPQFTSAEECDNNIELDTIFSATETLPQYPGGIEALMKYLSSTIEYPVNAQNKKIEERILVQFNIEKDGSISNVKIAQGNDPLLCAEAIRAVKSIPQKFILNTNSYSVSNNYFYLPINFKLDNKPKNNINSIDSDSISTALGIYTGLEILGQIESISDSIKINKEEIYKGIEYALNIDTTNTGKISGIFLYGFYMNQVVKLKHNKLLNNNLFLESFKNNMMKDSISKEELEKYDISIENVFNNSEFNDNKIDSLSIVLGKKIGGYLSSNPNLSKNKEKEELYKSIEYLINIPLSNIDYETGIIFSIRIYGTLANFESFNININKQIFLSSIHKTITNPISLNDYEKYLNYLEKVNKSFIK